MSLLSPILFFVHDSARITLNNSTNFDQNIKLSTTCPLDLLCSRIERNQMTRAALTM